MAKSWRCKALAACRRAAGWAPLCCIRNGRCRGALFLRGWSARTASCLGRLWYRAAYVVGLLLLDGAGDHATGNFRLTVSS